MNQQSTRTLQEHRTALAPDDALRAARAFFSDRNGIYSVFLEKAGPRHLVFRGQGGEELVVAVEPVAGGTRLTGSTYLFDQQLTRFFSSLPPYVAPPEPPALPAGEAVEALTDADGVAPGGGAA